MSASWLVFWGEILCLHFSRQFENIIDDLEAVHSSKLTQETDTIGGNIEEGFWMTNFESNICFNYAVVTRLHSPTRFLVKFGGIKSTQSHPKKTTSWFVSKNCHIPEICYSTFVLGNFFNQHTCNVTCHIAEIIFA